MVDLAKITTNGRALFLAYDQGMEHGPSDFDDESVDPQNILEIARDDKFNAVILQRGVAEKYYTGTEFADKVPLILKLNGKTNLLGGEPYSPLLCTVLEAQELGATAVGYTLYLGSEHEDEMLTDFSDVVREAHQIGMPVMVWMYPQGRAVEGRDIRELTAYGTRMSLELGADLVKIKYPENAENLSWAVQAAGRTKVIVAGGPKTAEEDLLDLAKKTIQAGAAGMAVGRNIWQKKNPLDITQKLKDIILEGGKNYD